jgi:tryptophan synthase alpha chain
MAYPQRLAAAFEAARGRTGLVPYLTAGFPDVEVTARLLARLQHAGALAAELGIPFSDPVADGPDIQRSSEHALRRGVHVGEVLGLVRRFRQEHTLPLVLMTYLNPVLRYGPSRFARDAREAGADGVLLTDLPADEAPEAWEAMAAEGLPTVVLVAPTTDERRLPLLLERASGFVYCLARTGVTGEGPGEAGDVAARVARIRRGTKLPVAVGFGISRPEQARALAGVADAVVVGAAFARAIAAAPDASAAEDAVVRLAARLIGALPG